jgi:hypothetical protein
VDLFRDLDVTRRYTLKLFSDGLIISLDFDLRVSRKTDFQLLVRRGLVDYQMTLWEVIYGVGQSESNLILVKARLTKSNYRDS